MNKKLPTHLRISNGYLQLKIIRKGIKYIRNFGPLTPLSLDIAKIHLAEKKKEILMGTFHIPVEIPERLFSEASAIYYERWCKETNPDGTLKHSHNAQITCKSILAVWLNPHFGNRKFNEILPKDVQAWRDAAVKKIQAASINRAQAVLSSIFNNIEGYVKREQIPAFKLPAENPCQYIKKSKGIKRTRIITKYECGKLMNAFTQLGDNDGWEICKIALKTALSLKDLRKLKLGQTVSLERAKTGVPVQIPLTILVKLNWGNFRRRWVAARKLATLQDLEFRDLRKSALNWLKGRHDLKLISELAGHADSKTTESFYTITEAEKLQPLVDDLCKQVDEIVPQES